MRLLSSDDLINIHQVVIAETGGASGLRDPGMLQAIAAKPATSFGGEELYPDTSSQAAALYEAVVNYHVFIDGNKRTSIAALGLFLFQNGYELTATGQALEDFTIKIANSHPDLADIASWIRQHTQERTTP